MSFIIVIKPVFYRSSSFTSGGLKVRPKRRSFLPRWGDSWINLTPRPTVSTPTLGSVWVSSFSLEDTESHETKRPSLGRTVCPHPRTRPVRWGREESRVRDPVLRVSIHKGLNSGRSEEGATMDGRGGVNSCRLCNLIYTILHWDRILNVFFWVRVKIL